METVETKAGTTLAMIAAYGAYKPLFRTEDGDFALMSIDFEAGEIDGLVLDGGDMTYTYKIEEATLILRPFRALCDPLPDGTVPAEVVAKMIRLFMPSDKLTRAYIKPHRQLGECVELERANDWACRLSRADFEAGNYRGLAVIDYLRSQHFAVGLEPHQFIEKQ